MELRTEVEIDAPPSRVWEVLMDVGSYPDWNPFIQRVSGTLAKGARLELTVTPPDGSARTFRATVTRFEEGRELGWQDKRFFKGVFDAEHFIQLSATDSGGTRLVNGGNYSGFLVQRMGNTLTQHARGFVGMNQALKRRVEGGR